jgi:hypothetical protein
MAKLGERIPQKGSTIILEGIIFRLDEIKPDVLVWVATHGDLDLWFASPPGKSIEKYCGPVIVERRHGPPMVTDFTPVPPPPPPSADIVPFRPRLIVDNVGTAA